LSGRGLCECSRGISIASKFCSVIMGGVPF
jgi:hypothetical protein